jgi:hypothetical protein
VVLRGCAPEMDDNEVDTHAEQTMANSITVRKSESFPGINNRSQLLEERLAGFISTSTNQLEA